MDTQEYKAGDKSISKDNLVSGNKSPFNIYDGEIYTHNYIFSSENENKNTKA